MIGITTADRSPKRNYIGATLRDLYRSSPTLDPKQVHVFATAPDVSWFYRDLKENGIVMVEEACILHVPRKRLTRNENGLTLLRCIPKCRWVLHLEDDLVFCNRFVESVQLWLDRYAPLVNRKVYNFCVFKGVAPSRQQAWNQPGNSFGALALAIRWKDAQDLARFVERQIPHWRPGMRKPWQTSGFDMMVRLWAREPFLASNPSFVQHAGDESLTHGFRNRPLMRSPYFAGADWSFS